jgi:hypothetical protein
MRHLAWGLITVAGIYGLHRVGLWAEARGWIYYRKRQGHSGALGTALLEVQKLLEPSKRHVVEERRKKGPATQEADDKPTAGRAPSGG